MYVITISLVTLLTSVTGNTVDTEPIVSLLSEKYDSYGEDWIFIPDGNNNPQVAVLKGENIEPRLFIEEKPAEYWLYTRSHRDKGCQLIVNDSKSLSESDFSATRPTILITHGWKSSIYSSGPKNLKDGLIFSLKNQSNLIKKFNGVFLIINFSSGIAYLMEDDYNIIMINWADKAHNTFYFIPMKNTEEVGIGAAHLIDFLVNQTGANVSRMHAVGHSLGGHVVGMMGSHLKCGKLGRITGLDPALPGFQFLTNDKRLDKTDAEFVEIIHTCAFVLGIADPIGHVDFYPNGGIAVQPGCCCIAEMMDACSHGRAWEYFTESINSDSGFLATKCGSWDEFRKNNCANESTVFMGAFTDPSTKGSYFFETRSKSPFAIPALDSTAINNDDINNDYDNDDCAEPGGWQIHDNNTRTCGTNSI